MVVLSAAFPQANKHAIIDKVGIKRGGTIFATNAGKDQQIMASVAKHGFQRQNIGD